MWNKCQTFHELNFTNKVQIAFFEILLFERFVGLVWGVCSVLEHYKLGWTKLAI